MEKIQISKDGKSLLGNSETLKYNLHPLYFELK